jgi:predicted nucleotidyltransferase
MPNRSIESRHDYVAALSHDLGQSWPTIDQARRDASEVAALLYKELRNFTSNDVDLVVFGSLARREWTVGSDVDWTLLIDGQVNADHRRIAEGARKALSAIEFSGSKLKEPGSEGIFGNMAFSHDIVHHIGGQADTNRNTTQRILLLLEATAIHRDKEQTTGPFDRISRQILNRYLASDSNFHLHHDQVSRIPRFLLNDIVRYWRTMCVDFAYKDWEQAGRKWALRNIKLRTSRKLLFVAGLLTVFSCYQNESLKRAAGADVDHYLLKLQSHLLRFVHASPLDILVWTLRELGLNAECGRILDHYEAFLAKINDTSARQRLADLTEKQVYNDEDFLECRTISQSFQASLTKVFFEVPSPLRDFTFEYGVF